jgi:prepilin-type N-terminal cleavage/methylation domain-containing protein
MKHARRAFTLVELLVALAITSVLVVLLANVVSATLAAWNQGRNRLDTFSNARQVIGRLGDELSAAVTSGGKAQFVENDTSLGSATPRNSESVFFVAPYPNIGAGDLCVIAYRHDAGANRLERAFMQSETAWAAAPANRYQVAGYPGSGTGGFQWRTVAEGVIEFEVQSFSQEDVDANLVRPANDTWDSAAANPTMSNKTPRRIVVRLRMVDDKTLVRLATMTPGSESYSATLQRAAREFFAEYTLPLR